MTSKIIKLYEYILSIVFIPNWIIPRDTHSLLDIGCGNGLPMKLINYRFKNIISLGIDGFQPYIDELRKEKIHTSYKLVNLEKSELPKSKFDVVICLQVIEHLSKSNGLKLMEAAEHRANKLVIFSTPYGKTEYGTDDGNNLQHHKSHYLPIDFEKHGYKVIKMGGKKLFGDEGLIYKTNNQLLRKLIISLDIICIPFYLFRQKQSDYYFFAYKYIK